MAATRDYYETLAVPRDISEADLKKAYRKLALKFHPDRNKGDESAAERFKEVSEAYEVLSDPEKRKVYDQYGHDGLRGQGFGGASSQHARDIFESFFGGGGGGGGGGLDSMFEGLFGGGGGRRPSGPRRGTHLRVVVHVTLKEAFSGTTKTLTIQRNDPCEPCKGSGAAAGTKAETCSTCHGHGQVQRQQGMFMMQTPCPKCRGEGTVIKTPCTTCHGQGVTTNDADIEIRIPAGIETGQQLRLANEGEPGDRGGPRGDLYCIVQVKEHSFFGREEDNLTCEIPVTYSQLTLGGEVDIPTLEGTKTLKIASGTQSGRVLRMRGQGMPSVRGFSNGDLLVRVQLATPKKLGAREKELLEELREIEGATPSSAQKSFFDKVKDLFD
ncbi:MAG: molecular chaperone DnaJ [Planctomycetota bacterium]|jgi:molecular chaperone DnaJ|nr:molecular chaperone DnaJ [Planctomycetota bacterium]